MVFVPVSKAATDPGISQTSVPARQGIYLGTDIATAARQSRRPHDQRRPLTPLPAGQWRRLPPVPAGTHLQGRANHHGRIYVAMINPARASGVVSIG
jgi:hypothetical protein